MEALAGDQRIKVGQAVGQVRELHHLHLPQEEKLVSSHPPKEEWVEVIPHHQDQMTKGKMTVMVLMVEKCRTQLRGA
jgi:hypothetical protein